MTEQSDQPDLREQLENSRLFVRCAGAVAILAGILIGILFFTGKHAPIDGAIGIVALCSGLYGVIWPEWGARRRVARLQAKRSSNGNDGRSWFERLFG